jgi:LmbE family N-acetylglucosaminyl deacetylase
MSYDAVYLSPHLDDAALSCGGQIAARARAGERVLVLTLFTGDEPSGATSGLIESLHGLFGLSRDVVARRRAEDERACAILGAEPRHAGVPEAIYRRDGAGAFLYDTLGSIFSTPSPAERGTIETLAEILVAFRGSAAVFAPLGVGGHVDHRLTRSAAEAVLDDLVYYEEMPYVERWGALRPALGRRGDWRPEIVRLESADLDAKVAACLAYSSQIEGLYRTAGRLESGLRRRAAKLGGERLWRH